MYSVAVDIYIQSVTQKFRWDGNYAPNDNKKLRKIPAIHDHAQRSYTTTYTLCMIVYVHP